MDSRFSPDTILKCPKGHEIKVKDLHSTLNTGVRPPTPIDDAIVFGCSAGKRTHYFNLRDAVGARMFTVEEAFKMVMTATVTWAKHKGG